MSRSRDNQAVNTYLLALKLTHAHNKYFLGFGPSNPKNDLTADLDFIKGTDNTYVMVNDLEKLEVSGLHKFSDT